jgi:hypothetical protein
MDIAREVNHTSYYIETQTELILKDHGMDIHPWLEACKQLIRRRQNGGLLESIVRVMMTVMVPYFFYYFRFKKRQENELPEPAVWVCHHSTCLLHVFLLIMAADRKLRGRNTKQDNPVTKLLFRQAGFIVPVQMAPGVPGTTNDYDTISSFKQRLLKLGFQTDLLLKVWILQGILAFSRKKDSSIRIPNSVSCPFNFLGCFHLFGPTTLQYPNARPVHLMTFHVRSASLVAVIPFRACT